MPLLPLFGHEALRARLLDALRRDALPASLLLHGPRGVGKQRLALWLGQALLCAGATRPCGECESCRFAAELAHPDLHWFFPIERLEGDPSVDDVVNAHAAVAAERVGKQKGAWGPSPGNHGIFVSTVGAILQQAARSPALARRKVFVIGDAERMVSQEGSDQAANAFLKLLEEPPDDTTLVLTSSEPGSLLPTIRSRVVALRVPPLRDAEVRAFFSDPSVQAALDADGRSPLEERVRAAAGAPGRLIRSGDRDAAHEEARRLLEAATSGSRARALRVAFAQGSAGARGAFSALLEALVVLLHARTRAAVERGDERGAAAAARAVVAVEAARQRAAGNVTPQLIAAALMRELAEVPR